MTGSEKLFSERYSVDLINGKVFDRPLTPDLRGWIGVTMVIHNQTVDGRGDVRGIVVRRSDVITEVMRLLLSQIEQCSPGSGTWRSIIDVVHKGTAEQVFDVIELMYGMLSSERQRLFARQINYSFQNAGLEWRLFRGEMMRLDPYVLRLSADISRSLDS